MTNNFVHIWSFVNFVSFSGKIGNLPAKIIIFFIKIWNIWKKRYKKNTEYFFHIKIIQKTVVTTIVYSCILMKVKLFLRKGNCPKKSAFSKNKSNSKNSNGGKQIGLNLFNWRSYSSAKGLVPTSVFRTKLLPSTKINFDIKKIETSSLLSSSSVEKLKVTCSGWQCQTNALIRIEVLQPIGIRYK